MRHRKLISLLAVPIASLALASCGQSKTVTVPNVQNKNVVKAYDVLHKAGLKVSILRPLTYQRSVFKFDTSQTILGHIWRCVGPCVPMVVRQIPRAGSSVARGSPVALAVYGNLPSRKSRS